MVKLLDKKVVLITGASSGIGQACARIFAQKKYSLAIGARRIDRINTLSEELIALGAPQVYAEYLDVTNTGSIERFYSGFQKSFEQLDVLINNAGGALGLEHIVDGDPQQWKTMLDTNVMGVLLICKTFLPTMIAAKTGQVINIGSIAGHVVYENGAAYCASKHALTAISRTLKLELNEHNIRVTSVDPGMVETEFSLVRLRDEEKAKKVYQGLKPLSAEDIAECVFFAADRPKHVNIDEIIVTPIAQASVYKVKRE